MNDIPENAIGIKIPCPECGKEPVVCASKAYGIIGVLLAYQISTRTVIGCQRCIKKTLLTTAGKNMLLGWWSISSAIINPFLTVYDIINAFIPKNKPNKLLIETLDKSAIPWEFLLKNEIFTPSNYNPDEVYTYGMLNLACAMMMADGEASPEEEDTIKTIANKIFPKYSTQKVQKIIDDKKDNPVEISKIGTSLGTMLTNEGKEMVLQFMMEIVDP